MDFEKAIIAAVKQFGWDIVDEVRLANILSDMNAYVEQPACKRILREVISSGVSMKIHTQPSTDLAKVYISQVVHDMSRLHGFQEDLIEYVLYSILNATKPEEERIQQNIGLQYEYIGSEDEFGFCDVQKNGKWGFISSERKEVVPAIYDSVGSFHEGLADVSKDGKFGFADTVVDIVDKFSEKIAESDEALRDFLEELEKDEQKDRDSSISSIIGYIGELIYEQYLVQNQIKYEVSADNGISQYDFVVYPSTSGKVRYVDVKTTRNTLADGHSPMYIHKAKDEFLKSNPGVILSFHPSVAS